MEALIFIGLGFIIFFVGRLCYRDQVRMQDQHIARVSMRKDVRGAQEKQILETLRNRK